MPQLLEQGHEMMPYNGGWLEASGSLVSQALHWVNGAIEMDERAKAEAMAALEQIVEAGTTAVDDLLDDLQIGQIKLLLDSLARASFMDGSYDIWACIQLYEDAGMPDGDSFTALIRWVASVDNLHRKELQVTSDEKDLRDAGHEQEEAADRAAHEGMIDREEEQMIRAEDARMNAAPDDSEDEDE